MRKFEHAIIVVFGMLLAFGCIVFVLHVEAERVKKEQQRRSEMYKYIGDE